MFPQFSLGSSKNQLLWQIMLLAAGMHSAQQSNTYGDVDDISEESVEHNSTEMGQNVESGNVGLAPRRSVDDDNSAQSEAVVVTWNNANSNWWADWQLPVFVVLFAVIGILALTFLILLWLKNQMLSNNKQKPPLLGEPGDACSTSGNVEGQQWIFHPVMPNPLEPCDSAEVQPQDKCVLPEVLTQTEVPGEKKPEPIRIKAKGLLERRGSSASLTIDLNPSQENLANIVTPTRECTTEEYLLSAGNVLSRGQLRSCLKNATSIQREFWDLPTNHPEKAEVAGSGTKNRYRSILPNEKTRVKLPVASEDPLAGYINANYLRGYDGEEKAFIATQGPLPHTVVDFWLMVWSENSPAIVMITNLWEKGRPKCEPYFPHEESDEETIGKSAIYGDITVEVQNVWHREGYVVREFSLINNSETRTVLHFWYDTWPDHKIPASAHSLVAMAREVEAVRQIHGKNGPIVVHCSAGIGRTGCFIAVSVGMNQLLEGNNVDILGIVCQMRFDRGGMIQTAEQYEFVHKALCFFEKSLPDQSGE